MDSSFLHRRIHSITGIIPVGLFLVYHLYLQFYLHSGASEYNERVNSFYDSPLAVWILILFVYLPRLYHSILGLRLSVEAHVQPQYQYFAHALYWLQRVSGVGVFLFMLGHLWNAKLVPTLAEGGMLCLTECANDHYGHLVTGFGDPETGLVTKAVYVLGVFGATFHLANGINTFCMTWGIALTPKGQFRVRIFSMLIFLLLSASTFYALSALW